MSFDVLSFVRHLRAKGTVHSQRKCAQRVREALQAGGAVIAGVHPRHAREWGSTLLKMGWREVTVPNPDIYHFELGDIVVLQPYAGGNPSGHIAGFDGKAWISDFIQRDIWSGPVYRRERPAYAIYRS